MSDSLLLNFGEFLVLLCALVYTAHIMVIDRFAEQVDPIKLSCVQFFTVGVVALPLAFIFETPTVEGVLSAWLPLLYAGVLSSGIAFTLQVVAQRYTEPTIAAITMSFESVFALLSGAVILSEIPTAREWVGSALMFGAILLSEIPFERLRSSPNPSRGEKNQDENNENKKKVRKKSCRYE
jgi:drug/metabolite transporter (DMT)-like permease